MAIRIGDDGANAFDAGLLDDYDETNQYTGLGGDDTLTGGALKDRLNGGEGSDVLTGDDGADILVDRGVTGDDLLQGGEGDDTIESRYGSDTLSGGAGGDTISFGFGSMLVSGGQDDDVFTSFGNATSTATISGGAGDDVFNAAASQDSFDGGQGIDLVDYSRTQLGVVINLATRATGGGAVGDSFRSVEDVVGTAKADQITGNGAYNEVFGGAGDDMLGGGFGGDFLDGGDGFDIADLGAGGSTHVVASLATGVFSGGGADGDTLLNFEGLAGSEFNDALTGDAAANGLIGRGGADTLDGGAGADTMTGGAGNDLYLVDSLDDRIVEAASEGTDTVNATFDYALVEANVENLNLIGPSALSGTGNGLANRIIGNDLANILDGGAGADSLYGGKGGDTYYVDALGDRLFEADDAGAFDQVFSSVSFNFQAQDNFAGRNIDRITLTGTADLDANLSHYSYDGEAIGNNGDNVFTTLGLATMTGGGGADEFFFRQSYGSATITDFTVGEDAIRLRGSFFNFSLDPDQLQIGGTSAQNGDVRVIYNSATGQLFSDRDGSGQRYQPLEIATLDPGLALTIDDFLVGV